jgi:hypothetical protein
MVAKPHQGPWMQIHNQSPSVLVQSLPSSQSEYMFGKLERSCTDTSEDICQLNWLLQLSVVFYAGF